jgi:dipeptidyl aminopeptidase/acylaminoacyl peptidase
MPTVSRRGWERGLDRIADRLEEDAITGRYRVVEQGEAALDRRPHRRVIGASPFMKIQHKTARLLLLQSEDDLRCPPEQSETLFAILRSRGVRTQMVLYLGETHFLARIGRPDRGVGHMRRIVEWFREYL